MPEFLIKREPKKEDLVPLPCRIEKDIMGEFKKIANEYQIFNMNGLITDAIKFALDNLKIEEDDE